jgi:predicted dehydrogenase
LAHEIIVTSPARVGLVGCGMISRHYLENAKAFDSFRVVACADLDPTCAAALANEHGLIAAKVEDLIADPSIQVVLNLTPPAAHADVSRRALAAGKHVYTEKPLASSVAEAEQLLNDAQRFGLRIGCAPDIFLGGAYQCARALIDNGAIGEPLSVSAAMLSGGPDSWHPNADFFFRAGGGPMLYGRALLPHSDRHAAWVRTPGRRVRLGPDNPACVQSCPDGGGRP